jgi:hypothetical protein
MACSALAIEAAASAPQLTLRLSLTQSSSTCCMQGPDPSSAAGVQSRAAKQQLTHILLGFPSPDLAACYKSPKHGQVCSPKCYGVVSHWFLLAPCQVLRLLGVGLALAALLHRHTRQGLVRAIKGGIERGQEQIVFQSCTGGTHHFSGAG